MSKYAIYARKSTESEDKQLLSIESQISELKKLADQKGIQIAEIYTESRSAKEPGRPVFNKIMSLVQKKEINGILCWKIDRLARNPVDEATVRWAVKTKDLEVITPFQIYSLKQDNSILSSIEFAMAEKYIDDLSKNVKRGNRAKLERGGWPGSAPLGYLNDRNTCETAWDPDRFELIRKMWDLMLTGNNSVEKIVNIANNEWGLRTRKTKRRGGKPISLSTGYKIFTNPFYYGLMQRNEGTFSGKHLPMISENEYEIVQQILGRKGKPKPKRHTFSFTGLIRCGECGCFITAEDKVKKTSRGVHFYTYYRCSKRKRDVHCSQLCVEVKNLEAQIVIFLEKFQIPDKIVQWAFNYLEEKQAEEATNHKTIYQSIQKAYDGIKQQLDELTKMRLRELLTDEEYLQQKNELMKQKIGLERRLNNPESTVRDWLEPAKNLLLFTNQAQKWFTQGDLQQKRDILKTVSSNLTLKDRKLFIEAKKPFSFIENCTQFPYWRALVEDVRTFVMKSPEDLKIPIYEN